jgi:N-acetyl-beta-hexosaminidase
MKITNLRKYLALLLAIVMVSSLLLPITANAATNWTVKSDTQIFWVKTDDTEANYEELTKQVQLFSSELAEKITGTALDITYGDQGDAGTNDIILILDSTADVKAQGYAVTATSRSIKIAAADADGLFYGCRYLIKQLLLNGSVASITDAPHVPERAVSLDNGRKHFSVDWIKKFIREMSWANMNALALHFSEEMGLGIESKLYPWLNGRDGALCTQAAVSTDNRYLTQDEVKEIVEYAKLYHVEIIPSLDSPGHMNYIVKKFNEKCANQNFSFTYDGVTYTAKAGTTISNYFSYNGKRTDVVPGTRNTAYSRGIDISNEIAVAFTKSLIEEYATLFADLGCTKFDIGGDELLGWGTAVVSASGTSGVPRWQQLDHWEKYAQNRTGNSKAVAYDAFLLYMNELNDLVRELGYTSVRMWNDDALRESDTGWKGVVQLDTNIDIWFWTTGDNIFTDYAAAGYQLYNIIGDYNYYAMTSEYFSGNRGSFAQAYADQIYTEWTPYIFHPADLSLAWPYNPSTANDNVLGGAFGIWCDNPTLKTDAQVMSDVLPLIRANAAKSWDVDVNKTVSYSSHTANWKKMGSAPAGTTAAPDVYVKADLTELEAAVAESADVDGSLYTTASYAAYTAAVNGGKALLATKKPEQADVDAAVAAIEEAKAALVLKPTADTSALEAAIAEYEDVDYTLYTGESFVPYTVAVAEGKALLASEGFTQDQLNAAFARIQATKDNLALIEDGVECIISGTARSRRVNVGKTAVLTVGVYKTVETIGVRVFDENGNEITPSATSTNTNKSDRNTHTFNFKPTAEDRGIRIYTVYVVLADGTLSADSIQFTFDIR